MRNLVVAFVVGLGVAVLTPDVALAQGASAAASATAPKPGVVDGAAAKALVASGAKVVDVRTAQEFASGHVPGAINIPYEEVGKRTAEIGPPSTPVVLYCRSGRRSAIAADSLKKAGYQNLYDMQTVTNWPGALAK
jgi:rhodanese-related sulfurtransferase